MATMADAYDTQHHKRPLPPPQSRQAVLLQMKPTDAWAVVDETEDLQILEPRKRLKFDHAILNNASGYPDQPFRPGIQYDHTQKFKRRDLMEALKPSNRYSGQRRSLFSSTAYLHRVQEENKTLRRHAKTKTPGVDKMDASSRMSKDADFLANRGEKRFDIRGSVDFPNSENAEEEARRLARITKDDSPDTDELPITTRPTDTNTRIQERSRNDIARERLEQASHAKSRALRERNLIRRLGGGQDSDPSSSAESEQIFDDHVDAESLSNDRLSPPSSVLDNEQYASSDQSTEELSNLQHTATPDVDQLFEVAKQAAEKYAAQWLQEPKRSYDQNASSVPLHPASRAAADRYRTQNRHIASDRQQPDHSMHQPRDHIAGEARLRALTSQTFQSVTVAKLKPQSHAPKLQKAEAGPTVLPSPKPLVEPIAITSSFLAPDLVNEIDMENIKPTPTKTLQSSLEPINALTSSEKTPVPSPSPSKSSALQPEKRIFETERTNPKLDAAQTPLFNLEQYPPEPSITVPRNFHEYNQEHQAVIREAELCKERDRDLSTIIPTFEQIAQLGTLDQFSDMERKEIVEVQDYVRAVVDHSLSGKVMRNRINNIRSNMARRIQRCSQDDAADSQGLLNALIKIERRQHIMQLISEAKARLAVLRSKRSVTVSKYHGKKAKKRNKAKSNGADEGQKVKQVTLASNPAHNSSDLFSNLPAGTEIELPSLLEPPQEKLTTTERKRAAQYAALDKKEANLRARLAMFSMGDPATDTGTVNDTCNTESIVQNDDNNSEVSEEEAGAEFFSHHPPLPDLAPNGLSTIDDLEPLQSSLHEDNDLPLPCASNEERHVSSQAQHQKLATSIQHRHKQRGILDQQKAQRSNYELVHRNQEEALIRETNGGEVDSSSEPEFDDLDTGSGEEEQSNEDRMCYRYVVMAICSNIMHYENCVDHRLGRFISSEQARTTVEQFKQDCKNNYKQSLASGESPLIREEYSSEEGHDEHKLSFGYDGESACRIVVEKEEFSPSDRAYQHAKVYRACNSRPVYTVKWERMKTYRLERRIVDDKSQSNNLADHGGCGSKSLAHRLSGSDNSETTPDVNIHEGDHAVDLDEDSDSLFSPGALNIDEGVASGLKPAGLPPNETIVISNEAQRFFSNIACANRHAADIFMQWWSEYFPGRDNYHVVRVEDTAMEKLLKRNGNRVELIREENFDRDVSDNEEKNAETDGDRHEGTLPSNKTMKIVRNDRIKVYVEKKPVVGPAN